MIQVVRVSGTVKKAEQEAIRRARASIMSARRAAGGNGENDLDRFLANTDGEGTQKGEAMEGIEDEDDDGEEDDDQSDDGDGVG